MLIEKNIPAENSKHKTLRYQPFFDLRKNIARAIAHYSMEAVRKGITMDINVSQETPNYFYANANCFVEIFSQLLKVSIASLDEGEIYIRICQNSVHQNNNCETDLSISIITSNYNCSLYSPEVNMKSDLHKYCGQKIPLANCTTLQRIKHLCAYLAGSLTLQKPEKHKTIYQVDCTLQQAFPANRLQLV